MSNKFSKGKIAILFPGQGSQFIGMGKELFHNSTIAKEVFERVDDSVESHLSEMMFHGDINELTITYNTQPAIMAVSMAVLKNIEHNLDTKIEQLSEVVAGHSLGEYSALSAIGAIDLSKTAKILQLRGKAMLRSMPQNESGAMLALLGVDLTKSLKIAQESAKITNDVCEVANDNGAGQFVLSGSKIAIDKAEEIAKSHGCPRAVKIKVGAAFHSSFMKNASEILKEHLDQLSFVEMKSSIIHNYNALPNNDISIVPDLLVKQTYSMVRWRETIDYMVNNMAIATILEVGPGKVLSTLAQKMYPTLQVFHIHSLAEIENFCSLMSK